MLGGIDNKKQRLQRHDQDHFVVILVLGKGDSLKETETSKNVDPTTRNGVYTQAVVGKICAESKRNICGG